MVADAARDGIGECAGERLLFDGRERRLEAHLRLFEEGPEVLDLVMCRHTLQDPANVRPSQAQGVRARELARERVPDEHRGRLPRQALPIRKAGVAQGIRRDVERQPVGEVRGAELAARHSEADPIELVARQEGSHRRVGSIRRVRIIGLVVAEAQACVGDPAKEASLSEHVLPELLWVVRSGIAAGHPDDGDPRAHSRRPGERSVTERAGARLTTARGVSQAATPRTPVTIVNAKKKPNTT